MDDLRAQSYAYLTDIELMFYVMTGCWCTMVALAAYWPNSMEAQSGTGVTAAVWLSTTILWSIAGAIALIGIMAYFILRQQFYSYMSWVLTEAGPRLHDALPAHSRVPLLWQMKKPGSGLLGKKQPFALFYVEQRYIQTCLALGINPSPFSWQIAGQLMMILAAFLLIVVLAVGDAAYPTTSKLPDIFAWARPLMPYLQLLVLGLAVTMQGGSTIWIASRYARVNAILDDHDAMAYAIQNSRSNG